MSKDIKLQKGERHLQQAKLIQEIETKVTELGRPGVNNVIFQVKMKNVICGCFFDSDQCYEKYYVRSNLITCSLSIVRSNVIRYVVRYDQENA